MGSLVRVQYRPPNQPCKVNLAGFFRFIPRLIFRSFASMEVFRRPPPVADSGRRKTVRGQYRPPNQPCKVNLAGFFRFIPRLIFRSFTPMEVCRRPPPVAGSGRRSTVRVQYRPPDKPCKLRSCKAFSLQKPRVHTDGGLPTAAACGGFRPSVNGSKSRKSCGFFPRFPVGKHPKSFVRFLHHLRLI